MLFMFCISVFSFLYIAYRSFVKKKKKESAGFQTKGSLEPGPTWLLIVLGPVPLVCKRVTRLFVCLFYYGNPAGRGLTTGNPSKP